MDTTERAATLVAELSESKNRELKSQDLRFEMNGTESNNLISKKRKLKQKTKNGETSEARRESHKIIEQKRRQKINDKINELRELLNYPDGSQNKAVVLQAAVDNIKNLKLVCTKLLSAHRQLQEEYLHILGENERLIKSPDGFISPLQNYSDKKIQDMGSFSSSELRLSDMSIPYLYDDSLISPRSSVLNGVPLSNGFMTSFGQDQVVNHDTNRQTLDQLLFSVGDGESGRV